LMDETNNTSSAFPGILILSATSMHPDENHGGGKKTRT
jgi:hypothetical protein